MDRSERAAAVLLCAIGAGVLCGGTATVGAAPAAADDSTTVSGVDGDQHRTQGRGHVPAPAEPGPSPDPCPWPWPTPPPPKLPLPPVNDDRGGLDVESEIFEPGTPVPTFGNGRAAETDDPDAIDFGLAPAQQAPASAAGAGAPAPTAVAPLLSAPAGRVATVPLNSPPVRNRPPLPPSTSPLPAQRSGPGVTPPVVVPSTPHPQAGSPYGLRSDDLGQIASTALPGLAALVGMTALGGVLGYRQARAGYLLRAAGAGRFLR